MYQTMKITALSRMIPFSDFAVVEKLSVDAVKYNFLQLKIDHLKGIVQFGSQVKNLIFGFHYFEYKIKPHLILRMLLLSVHGVFLRVSIL